MSAGEPSAWDNVPDELDPRMMTELGLTVGQLEELLLQQYIELHQEYQQCADMTALTAQITGRAPEDVIDSMQQQLVEDSEEEEDEQDGATGYRLIYEGLDCHVPSADEEDQQEVTRDREQAYELTADKIEFILEVFKDFKLKSEV